MPDLGWQRYIDGQEEAATAKGLEDLVNDLEWFMGEFPDSAGFYYATNLQGEIQRMLERGPR